MRKVISLLLSCVMILSMTCIVSGANQTTVEYVGVWEDEYFVTVPDKMETGTTDEVEIIGHIAPSRRVSVTSPNFVELKYQSNSDKIKTLVKFNTISLVGDYTKEVTTKGEISIDSVDELGIKVGTWSGVLTFNISVGYNSGYTVQSLHSDSIILFTISDATYVADKDMTWEEWVNSDYCTIPNFVRINEVDNNLNIYRGSESVWYTSTYNDETVKGSDKIVDGYLYTYSDLVD